MLYLNAAETTFCARSVLAHDDPWKDILSLQFGFPCTVCDIHGKLSSLEMALRSNSEPGPPTLQLKMDSCLRRCGDDFTEGQDEPRFWVQHLSSHKDSQPIHGF